RAVSSAPPWASAIEAVIIPRTAAIPSDLRIEPMCLLSDKERGYEGIEVGRFTAQQNTVPAKAGPTCYATMFRTWRGLSIDGDNARHNHAKGLSALSFGRQTADGGFQKLRALSSAVEQRTHKSKTPHSEDPLSLCGIGIERLHLAPLALTDRQTLRQTTPMRAFRS